MIYAIVAYYVADMDKKTEIDLQKQIELAAETLAHILIQQAMSKKVDAVNKEIETKYGKSDE